MNSETRMRISAVYENTAWTGELGTDLDKLHKYIERLSVTNLCPENSFADVSTECSSCHQGESGRKKCKTTLLF